MTYRLGVIVTGRDRRLTHCWDYSYCEEQFHWHFLGGSDLEKLKNGALTKGQGGPIAVYKTWIGRRRFVPVRTVGMSSKIGVRITEEVL